MARSGSIPTPPTINRGSALLREINSEELPFDCNGWWDFLCQLIVSSHPAFTRTVWVRYSSNTLYGWHSSLTTEQDDKRRDMPVPNMPRKLSWDERRAEAAEGPVRFRGGAQRSGVGQWQAGGL